MVLSNIIRGYELKESLGQGGFGAVYRAFQPTVGREVAIKVILPQYANQPEFIRRFEAEAQLVARLEHPHIVPLYDFWRDPQGAYLVMRYVRGGNLRQVINSGDLDLTKVITILEEIASALDTAHLHQVVHRDIKPDNILLDEYGNAYLSDFGIAQILKSDGNTGADSKEGTLTGSMGYLSPEQAKGDSLTRRSDIYSLAVIAYELLAGKHPFHQFAPTMQMVKHITEPLPPIAHFRADLSAKVDEILHRATSKKPDERYETAGEFIRALYLELGGATANPGGVVQADVITKSFPIINPYKGLRAFEEADSEDFFGRDALVRKLIERLETPTTIKSSVKHRETVPYRFLAVIGPSGSGKSSVVKAGLIPALRRGFLPGSAKWVISQMMPGSHPMEQLEQELLSVAARPVKNLHERLGAADGLLTIVPEILPDLNTEVLLVIDQFEEIFASNVQEKERVLFLENIQQAVTIPESRLRIVITLRADFYDRPLMYAKFGKLLQDRTEVVLPLTANELAQAIIAPSERMGIVVERGLAIDIATEVSDQPGALPLLQYALTELFDRREGHIMSRAAYRTLGGVMGALTRRAEDVYKSLSDNEKQATKILFQRLVTLGEGTEDTRRRALRVELDSISSQIGQVIDQFGKARLLSFDRDPISRTPTVEVAHEALIRNWAHLREWLNEDREHIRLQRHLTQTAQEWATGGKDTGDLYRGARLEQAREWAEKNSSNLNDLEREFLGTSLKQHELEIIEHEAQQKRELEAAHKLAESEKIRAEEHVRAAQRLRLRGRFLAIALVVSIIALFVAGWFGYQATIQRQQAEANFIHSEQLRLAAQASANLLSGTDLDAAPLLSLASLKLGYTQEADQTLQRAMTYTYPVHTLTGHSGSIFALAISPDSKIAATASTDQTILLWDINSGSQLRTLHGHTDSVSSLSFSPDGRQLASSSDDTTIRIWDVKSGAEVKKLTGHVDVVWGIAFSPDGKKIASVSYDQTLKVWNTQNGAPMLTVELPTTASALAYSPDGKYILIAGDDTVARLYDSGTGALIQEFHGHRLAIVSVAYSSSGAYIATGSDDATARVWDVETGESLTYIEGHQEAVYGVDFSSDDQYLLTASYDRKAILWDRKTGIQLEQFIGHQGSLYDAVLSPDDRWVLTGALDATARIWPSGISPNPRKFIHTGSVIALSISPDGKTLGTGTSTGDAYLWDTQTGQLRHKLSEHAYSIESLAFSPDGQYLVTAADDYTLRLWLTSTGKLLRLLREGETATWGVRFSPDGNTLIVASDDGLELWNAHGAGLVRVLSSGQPFYTATFSQDGKYVLAGGFDGIFLYETESGKLVQSVRPPDKRSYYTIAISPDGLHAVAGGGELIVMDFPSLEITQKLTGHTSSVLSTSYSPDGGLLISSSEDGSARIWDPATGQTIRILSSRQALANSAAFSKDGKQIYVGGADNTVWMWDVDYHALVTYACTTFPHDLSPEERLKYNITDVTPICAP